MKELINLGMEQVVTYTTRPMRDGEENGKDYWFIPEVHFLKLAEEGFFLETTSYNVANGQTWYYGTPIDGLTDSKAIIMNPDGVKVIKRHPELNPIVFYIMADEKTIKNRLVNRGDDTEEVKRRIEADNNDFKDINKYMDCCLFSNDEISPYELANKIMYIYKKERRNRK